MRRILKFRRTVGGFRVRDKRLIVAIAADPLEDGASWAERLSTGTASSGYKNFGSVRRATIDTSAAPNVATRVLGADL